MKYSISPLLYFDVNSYTINLLFLYEWSVHRKRDFKQSRKIPPISFKNLKIIAKTGLAFSSELHQPELKTSVDRLNSWLERNSSCTEIVPADEVGKLFSVLDSVFQNWKGGGKAYLYSVGEPITDDDILLVKAAFEEHSGDISCSLECLRFNQPTAAVFHIARAFEGALRRLAKKLKCGTVRSRATWQEVLDRLNAYHRNMPAKTKLQYDKQKTKTDILVHANSARISWRNEVMHPGEMFSNKEAFEVVTSCVIAMRQISKIC